MITPSCRLPRFPRARTFLSLSMLLAALNAHAQPVPRPVQPDPLVRMNESIDALTRKVWPSVVQILVSSYGPRNEGPPGSAGVVVGRQQSTGSGFVIDAEGYILTNAHVVNGARRVQIVLPADNADGTLATALSPRAKLVAAQIVGITTELDLAVLKVEGLKLPALPLATYTRGSPGRDGVCFREPKRTAQQPDARAGLCRGAAGGPRLAADLRPDRCADQSGQLRRPARQHPRGSGRRQHVHPVAIGRQ